MKQVLVTGGTGAVGAPIVTQLAAAGARVRCLVRTPSVAQRLFPEGVDLVEGDIEDAASVALAASGCDAIFHASGIPEQWTRDPGVFDRVNVEGTRHALAAATSAGVKVFLHVSTQDTFDLTRNPFDETMPSHDRHPSAYERSKIAAQTLVDRAGREGLPVRSVHPGAVYGPGAARPTGLTALLYGLRQGKVPQLLQGGMPVVFNEDVARGAIAAAERSRQGSKFILAQSYQTLEQIAQTVHALFPEAPVPSVLPTWLAGILATVGEPIAALSGKPPIVTRGILGVMTRKGRPSAEKAKRELGWAPISFIDGVTRTLT